MTHFEAFALHCGHAPSKHGTRKTARKTEQPESNEGVFLFSVCVLDFFIFHFFLFFFVCQFACLHASLFFCICIFLHFSILAILAIFHVYMFCIFYFCILRTVHILDTFAFSNFLFSLIVVVSAVWMPCLDWGKRGVMIIRAEEVASCADKCSITMRGVKLPNKDGLFGKSDPFFTISRLREDDKWQQVECLLGSWFLIAASGAALLASAAASVCLVHLFGLDESRKAGCCVFPRTTRLIVLLSGYR